MAVSSLQHDKAGAKAVFTAEIFVTARLIDSALGAKIGFQWLNRNAVTFQATIATAFTNAIIDHDPFRRIWKLTFLPPPPFLRRTGLNVNQYRRSRNVTQLALHLVQISAMTNAKSCWPRCVLNIFWAVANDLDFGDALTHQLLGDVPGFMVTINTLTAGERNSIIVEQLKGNINATANGTTNSKAT